MRIGQQRSDSVEAFATLAAKLADPFNDRAALLAGAGLDEAGWEETRRTFTRQLEAAAGNPETAPLCNRFRAAYEEALTARTRELGTEASAPAPAAPVMPTTADIAKAPAFTPSYLKQQEAPALPKPSHLIGAPLRAATPPPSPALRVEPAAPAPVPAASPAPPMIRIGAPGVRFGAEGGAPPAGSLGKPAPSLGIAFAGAAATPKPGIDSTAMLPSAMPGAKPSLPFEAPSSASPAPKPSSQPPKAPLSTGTRMASGAPVRATLPFNKKGRPSSGENLPGWSVERYAELCIDLHVSGHPRAEVLQLYGITEAQFKTLDSYWEEQLIGEPDIQKRWADASERRRKQIQ